MWGYNILWSKFCYKIGCNLRVRPYSISLTLQHISKI